MLWAKVANKESSDLKCGSQCFSEVMRAIIYLMKSGAHGLDSGREDILIVMPLASLTMQ